MIDKCGNGVRVLSRCVEILPVEDNVSAGEVEALPPEFTGLKTVILPFTVAGLVNGDGVADF